MGQAAQEEKQAGFQELIQGAQEVARDTAEARSAMVCEETCPEPAQEKTEDP